MKIDKLFDKYRLEHDLSEITIEPEILKFSLEYLNSEDAFESIEKDPYWPKWNSPWWHITLFYEMGIIKEIPSKIMEKFKEKISAHYIHFFPLIEEEIPDNTDPMRNIICHCALGTAYKLLSAYGFDTDSEFPWIRKWFLKYQLPDGGLNCDESVYTKEIPKSSLVSSLPPLEAMLFYAQERTEEENDFLDKGAEYLIRRKVFRRLNDNQPIDSNWLQAFFPRFYEFDILRALSFLLNWSLLREKEIHYEAISDSLEILYSKIGEDSLFRENNPYYLKSGTIFCNAEGIWKRKEADKFPLLEHVISSDSGKLFISSEWHKALDLLKTLQNKNLLKL